MTVNQNKYTKMCMVELNKIINAMNIGAEYGISLSSILRKLLLLYPVSVAQIEKLIDVCYVRDGIIIIQDNILIKIK